MKLFYATESWLKDRLGLDISPEKSKVINLKEEYSEFLGFKLKVVKRGKTKRGRNKGQPKYVVESHVRGKAMTNIKAKLDELIYAIQHPQNKRHSEYEEISKYNSFVIGVHDYYCMATKASLDFRKVAFSVHKSLRARLQKRVKTAKMVKKKKIPCHITNVVKERYGRSEQLRYVNGIALAPIGYIRHEYPIQRKPTVNSYTVIGRAEIHKNLENVDMNILHYLMRNPVANRSIEYNDNRLSLYAAQKGKCAVTRAVMEIGDIHCHNKTPRYLGGTDAYQNLVLVCENVRRAIYATSPDAMTKHMDILNLKPEQLKKLENLRSLVHVESC